MEKKERKKIGNRILLITVICNFLLSFFKIIAGIVGNSGAMVADGIHSATDIITTITAMIGVNIAEKPRDVNHPYGHEKLESIAASLIAIFLILTAIGIAFNSVKVTVSGEYRVPEGIVLYIALISAVIKEGLYRYILRGARILNSSALFADAWHHRSDVLTSCGTFVAVVGTRMGFKIFDPLKALVISLLIIKMVIKI